jgi:hypothetical protein
MPMNTMVKIQIQIQIQTSHGMGSNIVQKMFSSG